MRIILSLVVAMALDVLAKSEDWTLFNSSLLIEVTRSTGVFTCSGVAVAPEILVTAAHCLEGDVKKVRVFTQSSYDPEQPSLEVKSFKLHPDYDSSVSRYKSDVAKIILSHRIPQNINLHPIFEGQMVYGEVLRFGFGGRNDKNVRTVMTPRFRKMDLQENILELDDKFSRSGDSGGPVFMRKGQEISLLAIHSTFSFGPQGEYSLNPRLASYLGWIYEN